MSNVIDFKVRIKNITASDGNNISLEENDAIIVVGPNNSGKSQLLRDIKGFFGRTSASPYIGKAVSDISIYCPSFDNFRDILEKYKDPTFDGYSSYGVQFHSNALFALKKEGDRIFLGATSPLFVIHVSADTRLSITDPSPALGPDRPTTPGQILYDSESLLNQVSSIFRKAFGKDLFLDYRSGAQIPIYVGEKPNPPKGCDRVSDEYVALVRKNDKLHDQGDGMKSFGGILLSTLVVHYNVSLVDEPEAFLHPPQERIIGKILANNTTGQIICATHSKDVLQGFLESGRENIRVIRLTRNGLVNTFREIGTEEIRELWDDPIFRYSTALDGLFHDRVVLCEADPDCKFYEAIGSSLNSAAGIDSHFVPCGGKAAFPKFIKALSKLDIPVVSILDLDVLNDEETIRKIYEAHGGIWKNISSIWKRVDAAVRKGVPADNAEQTKKKIGAILDGWHDGAPPTSRISEALKQTRPWAIVKEMGSSGIPKGDSYNEFNTLISKLNDVGIYPVLVGTLENFARGIGNKGIKWLNNVLSNYDLSDSELTEAREFVAAALR